MRRLHRTLPAPSKNKLAGRRLSRSLRFSLSLRLQLRLSSRLVANPTAVRRVNTEICYAVRLVGHVGLSGQITSQFSVGNKKLQFPVCQIVVAFRLFLFFFIFFVYFLRHDFSYSRRKMCVLLLLPSSRTTLYKISNSLSIKLRACQVERERERVRDSLRAREAARTINWLSSRVGGIGAN